MARGAAARHTSETAANAASSRSHCVFTCTVESKAVEGSVTHIRSARLSLVDLAGMPLLWKGST